jgi:thioester reductase-like protein
VLFVCIKDGLQHLAAGTKCSLYIPHLRWAAVERDMGLPSTCAHLHSQEPSDSSERTRNGSGTNGHDSSELLKQVVDLLDIAMADFSPELPFSAYGLDSLGATRISQVVRPYASVSQMQLLGGLSWKHLEERIKEQSIGEDSVLKRSPIDDVLEVVAQYSKEFAPHTGTDPLPSHDVVLVTGTTGTIGSNVLAQLVVDPKVGKVYALNREGSTPSDVRQRIALRDRGLDPSVVDSPKVVFLEGTVSQPRLGLVDELCEELRKSVTHVIHIGRFRDCYQLYAMLTSVEGWRVDLNMGLAAFEDDIKGVRNLIDLTLSSYLSSPPHFLFPSSPAVVHSAYYPLRSPTFNPLFIPTDYPGAEPVPEVAAEVQMALGTGYGESKWICEEILAISRAETTLQPVIVRIGQVSGGVNGYWKPSEWIPSIIQSVTLTGCLPSLDRVSKPLNILTSRTNHARV